MSWIQFYNVNPHNFTSSRNGSEAKFRALTPDCKSWTLAERNTSCYSNKKWDDRLYLKNLHINAHTNIEAVLLPRTEKRRPRNCSALVWSAVCQHTSNHGTSSSLHWMEVFFSQNLDPFLDQKLSLATPWIGLNLGISGNFPRELFLASVEGVCSGPDQVRVRSCAEALTSSSTSATSTSGTTTRSWKTSTAKGRGTFHSVNMMVFWGWHNVVS